MNKSTKKSSPPAAKTTVEDLQFKHMMTSKIAQLYKKRILYKRLLQHHIDNTIPTALNAKWSGRNYCIPDNANHLPEGYYEEALKREQLTHRCFIIDILNQQIQVTAMDAESLERHLRYIYSDTLLDKVCTLQPKTTWTELRNKIWKEKLDPVNLEAPRSTSASQQYSHPH